MSKHKEFEEYQSFSLQDEIREILFNRAEVFPDFEETADLVINTVLDAVIDKVVNIDGWESYDMATHWAIVEVIQVFKVDVTEGEPSNEQ